MLLPDYTLLQDDTLCSFAIDSLSLHSSIPSRPNTVIKTIRHTTSEKRYEFANILALRFVSTVGAGSFHSKIAVQIQQVYRIVIHSVRRVSMYLFTQRCMPCLKERLYL